MRIYLLLCLVVLLLPVSVNGFNFYISATVTVNPVPNFTISLSQGWNLISSNLVFLNTSIEAVLADIMDKVIVVNGFDGGAKTYVPGSGFNDLHDMDHLHGYWIKMSQDDTLVVNGRVPSNKTIVLAQNWNLISYLCNSTKNVTDVFSGIMDKVIIINAFEAGGKTYDPNLPEFSDLHEMKPGFGYWIKMNQTALLDYACQE